MQVSRKGHMFYRTPQTQKSLQHEAHYFPEEVSFPVKEEHKSSQTHTILFSKIFSQQSRNRANEFG